VDDSGILKRYPNNPILTPNSNNWWESQAVFNCATFYDGNKVHMLYRAIGEYENYVSRIGYASSQDGYSFKRRNQIAFDPILDYEQFGIEDPRLSKIEDKTYMTYVILSEHVKAGPAVSTALAVVTKDYSDFERLGIITSKEMNNKDVVLFPEKLSSKKLNKGEKSYFSLHRPSSWIGKAYGVDSPSIWLGESSRLNIVEEHTLLMKPEFQWEQLKIGAGPPPIKTKYGWLIIYHGVSMDRKYSAGAAILDLDDPSKMVCRCNKPILTPTTEYEKSGDVDNVVFPTGLCNIDGELFLYYGGADKVCCLATVELDDLIQYIFQNDKYGL
jgi:predicted GH43/DUF377 family glycosyl hydrolase